MVIRSGFDFEHQAHGTPIRLSQTGIVAVSVIAACSVALLRVCACPKLLAVTCVSQHTATTRIVSHFPAAAISSVSHHASATR